MSSTTMSAINELREAVRRRLSEEGKSQAWLAAKLGTSQPYINDVLTGRITPTMQRCEDMARVLGIQIQITEKPAAPV